jgi:tetraacyldisaccharide 4'-kinase
VLTSSEFRELVSGRRPGVVAHLLRFGLWLAQGPYVAVVRWRNRRYDTRPQLTHRVGVPVVSVGNLSLGGTGKTPMVEWIARWFRRHDVRVTIISRGYGAEAGAKNDEALELEQRLPDVPHLQNPDRVAAAQTAIEELDCQLILLDDAFQHRRIGRDLDIVLLDALEPFGFEHVFPRGTLREPVAGIARADAVLLSRADMLKQPDRDQIRDRVRRHAPAVVWIEATHAPRRLINSSGREAPLDRLSDRPLAAFCGIGNPAGFRHTLETCGWRVAGFREFPDHHRYERRDIESLTDWADKIGADAVVCTCKDLVKLGVDSLGPHPLWAIDIGLEFLNGQAEFEASLARRLP